MAVIKSFTLLAVVFLACACVVLSTPVSFPDSQPTPTHQKDAEVSEQQPEAESHITPPSPTPTDEDAEPEDEAEVTVSQIVDRVPQILDRIQNYINSAIVSYSSNDTAANQPPAQLNQFLGLVDGFISVTNNFAQQFLQPATAEETEAAEQPAVPVGDNNEIVYEKVE